MPTQRSKSRRKPTSPRRKSSARAIQKKSSSKSTSKGSSRKRAPSKAALSKKRSGPLSRTTKPVARRASRPTIQTLSVGDLAPAFEGYTSEGATFSSAQVLGVKPVVLYFYPKDDTPGCTAQACGFRDTQAEFKGMNVEVIGVSPDSPSSHLRFAEKYSLPFPLIADEDHEIATRYGVWGERMMYGRSTMGIRRTTFIIDGSGRIVHIMDKVNTDGHEQEVLNWLRMNLITDDTRSQEQGSN